MFKTMESLSVVCFTCCSYCSFFCLGQSGMRWQWLLSGLRENCDKRWVGHEFCFLLLNRKLGHFFGFRNFYNETSSSTPHCSSYSTCFYCCQHDACTETCTHKALIGLQNLISFFKIPFWNLCIFYTFSFNICNKHEDHRARTVARKFSIGGFAVLRRAFYLFGEYWDYKNNQNSTYL